MNNPWNATPFIFWLYAQACAKNETTSATIPSQIRYWEGLKVVIPQPKTRWQAFLHKFVLRVIDARLTLLIELYTKGAIATGWIPFAHDEGVVVTTDNIELVERETQS